MHRFLLLLLLVVLAGVAACFYWVRGGDTIPMVRLTPARPIVAATPSANSGLPADASVTVPPLAQATRTDASAAGVEAPELAALLDVLVVSSAADASAASVPLEGIDVGITVAASETAPVWRELRCTDRSGRVHFAVPAGDARLAQVFCAPGGEASARLAAAEPGSVTLRVLSRCQVEGLVVNAGGQPVAGAEIVFLPWNDRSGHGLPCSLRVGTSRGDGTFRIGLLTGGRIGAWHRDFAPSTMHVVQPEPDRSRPASTKTLRLSLLTMPARARGIVVDADGRPAARATLEFRAVEQAGARAELSAPPQRTRCDDDGRFTVQHLRPGAITWCARCDGHGTSSGTFEVAPGATADLHLPMARACTVRGVVQDAAGTPAAGVQVWSGSEGAFDGTTDWSGADGTFWLRNLAPGATDLTAREVTPRAPGRSRGRATTRLDLLPGVTEWQAVLDAESGPLLRGIVVDSAGTPLAHWRILAQQGAAAARPGRTNAAGEFAVQALGADRFAVHVFAPDQALTSFAMGAEHGIDAAQGIVRITIDLSRLPAVVRGVVQSNLQEPLAASVACWHHELRANVPVLADANGAYRFDRVPAGTIDIYFDHPGHVGVSQREVVVPAGADLDLGLVRLGAGSAVHGVVTGPDGLAPAQLQISILTADKQLTAEYAAGTYRLTAVPPGKHVLQVQGPGVAAAKFPIDVPAGTEVQQDIELQPGIARKFRIEFAAGSSAWVTLALRQPNESHTWISGQAARGGAFVEFVAFMAPGSYEALAWGNDGLQGRATVVFTPGDESEVRIALAKR